MDAMNTLQTRSDNGAYDDDGHAKRTAVLHFCQLCLRCSPSKCASAFPSDREVRFDCASTASSPI
ncbi:hypothetical protein PIB30_046959 [Stylosanthes scabra]|uniref:Uncharacterized protein n=1 Tax=Stylosanthes scabra TaxID=79078 RepID=A0ABU6SHC7_9FABA|nr:hypothetical protein [Stylosanthes scabra]